MDTFIQQHEKNIIGHLSGFDRLVLRGTLRALAAKTGMLNYLWHIKVPLKEFARFFKEKSEQLKAASCEQANRLKRPILYLTSPRTSKEDMAREIAQKDRIREGLICILTTVEVCRSYELVRNREQKKLELHPRTRKCLFLYHYWMHPVFGFMHGRIQSWFPFNIQICLNGREWLARQMDRVGLRYQRQENCFLWVEDMKKAQALMDKQLRTEWPSVLDQIARGLNPAHVEMLAPYRDDYYWTTHQSEWATDILFKSPQALAQIYPTLVRLFPGRHETEARRRFSARVTYRLRILRAHGIIRKVPRTSRYILTNKGRIITSAIIQTQHIPITKLSQLAA